MLRVREKELKYQRRNFIIEVRYTSTSEFAGYFGDVRVLIYPIFRLFSMQSCTR